MQNECTKKKKKRKKKEYSTSPHLTTYWSIITGRPDGLGIIRWLNGGVGENLIRQRGLALCKSKTVDNDTDTEERFLLSSSLASYFLLSSVSQSAQTRDFIGLFNKDRLRNAQCGPFSLCLQNMKRDVRGIPSIDSPCMHPVVISCLLY